MQQLEFEKALMDVGLVSLIGSYAAVGSNVMKFIPIAVFVTRADAVSSNTPLDGVLRYMGLDVEDEGA